MGRNMVFQKVNLGQVRVHLPTFVVSGPKFTKFVSLNAGGIAVDQIVFRLSISWSVPEIFVT